jgi:hypothetical protein
MNSRSSFLLSIWRCASLRARATGYVGLFLMLGLLAGCEAADIRFGAPDARVDLISGSYDYRARSDFYRDLAWWGELNLRVDGSGRITARYRLPRQCRDRFGRAADCEGRVAGRVYRDGRLDFYLDDGWLTHEGTVTRRSDVFGRWWTRLAGHRDEGRFELIRY